jgi:hypothetical protein
MNSNELSAKIKNNKIKKEIERRKKREFILRFALKKKKQPKNANSIKTHSKGSIMALSIFFLN